MGSEAKFKVGDSVEYVGGGPIETPYFMGRRGVIVRLMDGSANVQWRGDAGVAHGLIAENLRLVAPANHSPIRTITRREIVPGEYGGVTVYDSGYVTTNNLRGSTDLREAARIFNEIADVLDEQSAEAKEAA